MTRKYSVAEIDDLRQALEWLNPRSGLEDRLRTYMLNGTTAEEVDEYRISIGKKCYVVKDKQERIL